MVPAPAGAARGGGGGGRGRGEASPEQQAAQREHAAKVKAWRTSVSMDAFKKLRQMYNDASVTIYATKMLSPNMSDEEFELHVFNVAEALGATHTTLELPTDDAQLKRIGELRDEAEDLHRVPHPYPGQHDRLRQGLRAVERQPANVDFGHWVAAGNVGGTPMRFLEKHHGRVAASTSRTGPRRSIAR